MECIATCEIDLSSIWEQAGAASDFVARPFTLLPTPEREDAYPSGSAGTVLLTLMASKALAALKAACS